MTKQPIDTTLLLNIAQRSGKVKSYKINLLK